MRRKIHRKTNCPRRLERWCSALAVQVPWGLVVRAPLSGGVFPSARLSASWAFSITQGEDAACAEVAFRLEGGGGTGRRLCALGGKAKPPNIQKIRGPISFCQDYGNRKIILQFPLKI